MEKDYIIGINKNAERRFFAHNVELRAGENSRTIVGYAAVFNKDSLDLGGWIERISPGAFDDVLSDDCFALFNHDPNMVLARNSSTLKISVDGVGLRYEFEAPNTSAGNDLLENVRLKNITQSSFGFTIKEQNWSYPDKKEDPAVRTIIKISQLYDVSPVTYPAYPDTSVASRSLASKLEEMEQETRRDLVNIFRKQNQLRKLNMELEAA